MTRLRLALAAAAAGALTLSACGSGGGGGSADADGTTTVKVAYTPIYSIGALQLGVDQGFFEDEGLQLELQQVANSPAGIAAVAGSQVQFNYSPSIPLINASAGGVALKVVAAADGYADGTVAKVEADPTTGADYDDTAVVANPDAGISSAKDLAGKTVSVPARQAQLEVTIADAVEKDGGDPSTIKWITLDFPSAVSSLKSGRIDAAGLVAPFIGQATAAGGEVVSSPGVTFFGDGAVGLWITSAAYAEKDPKVVAAFQRAVNKANAYANDHLDEEQAAAAEVLKTDVETVKGGATPYFPTTVGADSLGSVAAAMKSLGYLKKDVDTGSMVVAASQD